METFLFECLIVLRGMGAEFLNTQYRMHPALAVFPSGCFYEGKLLSGTPSASCPKGFPYQTERPIAIDDVPGRDYGRTSPNSDRAQIDVAKDMINGFLAAGFVLGNIVLLFTYKDQVEMYEKENRPQDVRYAYGDCRWKSR